MKKVFFSATVACALFAASFANAQTAMQSSSKTTTVKAQPATPASKGTAVKATTVTKQTKMTKAHSTPAVAK